MHYEPIYYLGKPSGSLCWFCQKAACGSEKRCTWSRSFNPVPGWEAIPTKLNFYKKETQSFCVQKCPEFLFEDGSGRLDPREIMWRCLKYEDGTPVYEDIGDLVVTTEVS